MNSGFLGPAIATVLTACGIETSVLRCAPTDSPKLQQYLPLAVLKRPASDIISSIGLASVATVLTACGIETLVP